MGAKGKVEMATDRSIDNRNTGQTSTQRRDPVHSKLSALLDDVTVHNGSEQDDSIGQSSEQGADAAQQRPRAAGLSAEEQTNPTPPTTAAPATPSNQNQEVAQIAAQIKSIQAGGANRGAEASAKSEPPRSPNGAAAVSIKGRGEGIAIEIGKGPWPTVLEELRDRLTQSGKFFQGGNVALDVGSRPLLENELEEVLGVLTRSGMKLSLVRTGAERTFAAAIALGLAARLTSTEGVESAEVEPASSNHGLSNYYVYRGNLRSGQVLARSEHIMVIGEVNPGAEVISQGDIMVWGRMRGIAHAGAGGDQRSVVVALHLDPIQVRIASTVAIDLTANNRNRGLRRNPDKRPEVAFIANNQIVIEPWDETKPGGLSAFRR